MRTGPGRRGRRFVVGAAVGDIVRDHVLGDIAIGNLPRMPMPLGKVSFCDGELAIDAVPEFYPGVAAGKIGAEEFGPVLDVIWDDEIGRLGI